MGYDVQKFVEVVDANLLCGICGLIFEDPVLTPCGHSFCLLCLETWLETSCQNTRQRYQTMLTTSVSVSGSCPECREAVRPNEAKSELSLRNLINGFYTYCEFRDRGCHATVRLERAKNHASRCPHSPVICAGCDESVRLIDLPNHQIHCRGIAETIGSSDDNEDYKIERGGGRCVMSGGSKSNRSDRRKQSVDLSDLLEHMEKQMDILKEDLLLADVNNAIIESEYLLRKSEMKRKEKVLLARNVNSKKAEKAEGERTSFQNVQHGSTVTRVGHDPRTNININTVTESQLTSFQNGSTVSRAGHNPRTITNTNTNSFTEPQTSFQNGSTSSRAGHDPRTNINTNTHSVTEPQTSLQNPSAVNRAGHDLTSRSRAGLNWLEYPGDQGRILPNSGPSIPPNRLASFIFRFLLNKPDYIDSRMVFSAIQCSYDHFVSSSVLYDQSVHILVSIASASDWFTSTQCQNFSQWLQSLAKCQELLDSSPLS